MKISCLQDKLENIVMKIVFGESFPIVFFVKTDFEIFIGFGNGLFAISFIIKIATCSSPTATAK